MSTSTKITLTVVTAIALVGFVLNEWRLLNLERSAALGTNAYLYWRIGAWIGALSAIGIYSFLIKENPAYRFCEHILLGCAMGYMSAPLIKDAIVERCIMAVYNGVVVLLNPGSDVDGNPHDIWLIFAAVIGLLWYFQFSRKYLWLSRLALGITVGAGSGLGFKRFMNELMPQITETFKDVWIVTSAASWTNDLAASAHAAIFVIATVCVLMYFFFAFDQKNPAVRGSARLGRLFLMVALGAFFGNTFMSRLSALIERFNFLVEEWLAYEGV